VPALQEVSASDPAVLQQWQSLLSQAERPGDLAADPVAWQRGRLTAGQRNSRILKAVLDSACQSVERALADRKGWNRSEGLCGHRRPGQGRSVTSSKDMAQFGLYIPGSSARSADQTRRPLLAPRYTGRASTCFQPSDVHRRASWPSSPRPLLIHTPVTGGGSSGGVGGSVRCSPSMTK